MPNTLDPSLRELDNCDGCDGVSAETPVRVDNRPGLSQIDYRVGTHARFLESMLARLSNANYPMLRALKTRENRDLTIALLDACAAVDDIMTFYTQRYGHEWFVRTAIERVSLVQLARLIGYEPRPGVAATAYLAFTMSDTPGTPEKTTLDAGIRVMSIPGKDELPQTFETSAAIEARSVWNAMKVRTQTPQVVATDMSLVVLTGIDGGIRRGDSLLIVVSDTETAVKRVQKIAQDPVAVQTYLELTDAPTPSSYSGGYINVMMYSGSSNLTSNTVDSLFGGTIYSASDTYALGSIYNWSEYNFYVAANTPPPPPPAETGVYALRQRAAIYGHNAPSWANLPQIVQNQWTQVTGKVLEGSNSPETDKTRWQYPDNWDNFDLTDNPGITNTIDLDNTYPAMTENSWVVLESPDSGGDARAYRVITNQELSRNDYTLSVKVTRLTLDKNDHFSSYKMRHTTVLGQSDQLPLATVPFDGGISDDTIILGGYYPGLVAGQPIIVSGTRTDLRGVVDHEVAILADVLVDGTLEAGLLFTVLKLSAPLAYTYDPVTVTVNANVVAATHGETKSEVMGGGDASQRYQTFTLKQKPLTYISAQTATGAQSTLAVRVNQILWTEAPTLYGYAPDDQVYVIRNEDDGTSKVQFNAPLPTGMENVTATYRIGIGLPGMVNTDQLSLLTVRPLGVRSVTNPLAANGAQDPEVIEDLRANSPLTVLTMDRLVSLQDYEDFARAFAGFSKALATPTVDGAQRGVFLTVAGATGLIVETDAAFGNLVAAIKSSGDPFVSVIVAPYVPVLFQIEATIGVDAKYLPDVVAAAVMLALQDRYGFSARKLGQSVTQVDVIATIQNIPGVVFVNLTALFVSDPSNPTASLADVLTAAQPTPGTSRFTAQAAELLTLDPRPIQITTVVV